MASISVPTPISSAMHFFTPSSNNQLPRSSFYALYWMPMTNPSKRYAWEASLPYADVSVMWQSDKDELEKRETLLTKEGRSCLISAAETQTQKVSWFGLNSRCQDQPLQKIRLPWNKNKTLLPATFKAKPATKHWNEILWWKRYWWIHFHHRDSRLDDPLAVLPGQCWACVRENGKEVQRLKKPNVFVFFKEVSCMYFPGILELF